MCYLILVTLRQWQQNTGKVVECSKTPAGNIPWWQTRMRVTHCIVKYVLVSFRESGPTIQNRHCIFVSAPLGPGQISAVACEVTQPYSIQSSCRQDGQHNGLPLTHNFSKLNNSTFVITLLMDCVPLQSSLLHFWATQPTQCFDHFYFWGYRVVGDVRASLMR